LRSLKIDVEKSFDAYGWRNFELPREPFPPWAALSRHGRQEGDPNQKDARTAIHDPEKEMLK